MEKIILHSAQSPGDIVMLTAAVRDLHRAFPNRFQTDVRTSCAELWENNPYVTALDDDDDEAKRIECHYPLIHRSNQAPYHFIHGYVRFLADQLQLSFEPSAFRGDIHLSEEELRSPGFEAEMGDPPRNYWLIVAGGKYDFTIKWWHRRRWQEVVDYFKGRIQFVQIGEKGHYHPQLNGAIDLRGRTKLRDLVRLVQHSDGVLCPVTFAMHLAAALPMRGPTPRLRPCVVIAGGREPVHWEAYPGHQFLHTVGSLPCCAHGGCWKSRTIPLGDGATHDEPGRLCVRPMASGLPECMAMIEPRHVINRVEWYLRIDNNAVSTHRPITL